MGQLTEKIEISLHTLDPNCPDPVYLCWLNDLGGWNFWLFTKNNTLNSKTAGEILQDVYNEDYNEAESFIEKLFVNQQDTLNLIQDQLTREEALLLQGLVGSFYVSILTNPFRWEDQGAIWERVLVNPKSFEVGDRKSNFFEISFSINRQPKNKQWA